MSDHVIRAGDVAGHARSTSLADTILRLIWQEKRISRAEIARRTDLARSTVSEAVGAHLPTGLVAEIGHGPSRGGRRPIVLEFQDDAGVILGVEVGGAHVGVALTDLRGRVLVWRFSDHPVRSDPEGTRALVAELCRACLDASDRGEDRLVGIGVAMPSPVDPKQPERLSTLVMPDWKGSIGLEFLGEKYGVPLFVDNDANLGALAEQWWGVGQGADDFTYVKLGTGIGSGHVIHGEIYRGATGVAGEIGHLAIDPHGGPCMCGLRGCLVTFIGSLALVTRARALLGDHPGSVLTGRPLTIDSLETAALDGDPLALQVAHEAAEYLGIALAGMLNLMNPSRVILGGGLARLGRILLDPLQETVRRRTLVSSVAAAEILTSQIGPQAVAIGAATMVLKAALDDPRLFPAPVPGGAARR